MGLFNMNPKYRKITALSRSIAFSMGHPSYARGHPKMIVIPQLKTMPTCQMPGELTEGFNQISNQRGKAIYLKIQDSVGRSDVDKVDTKNIDSI